MAVRKTIIKQFSENIFKTPDIYDKLTQHAIEREFTILIKECIQGKRQSQKKIYQAFYEYAISICLRYASNNEDAVEIMNDGFLKMYDKLSGFKPKHDNLVADYKAWFKQILIYTAIDHCRKQSRKIAFQEVPDTIRYDTGIVFPTDTLTYKEIISCIQKLTPAYRAVFSLFVIDGFTHEEIARQLGIETGTSKSNLAKARIQLQKMLCSENTMSYDQQRV